MKIHRGPRDYNDGFFGFVSVCWNDGYVMKKKNKRETLH